jgi:outer membrane autotransporter protein
MNLSRNKQPANPFFEGDAPLFKLLICFGLLVFVPNVTRADTEWLGGSGDWFDADNWSDGNPELTTGIITISPAISQPVITENSPNNPANDPARVPGTLNIAPDSRLQLQSASLEVDNNEVVNGTFLQTGGNQIVDGVLTIDTTGRYVLQAGSLTAGTENVFGYLIQSGGINTATNLNVDDRYDLDGGDVNSNALDITFCSPCIINQNGGTNTINGNLRLGIDNDDGTDNAVYNLKNGTLTATNENIGGQNIGLGTFNQTGGKNTVTDTLTINPKGSYTLSGGTLEVANMINNGNFIQTGGSVTGNLTNNQRYAFSTGSFTGNLLNNGSLVFDTRNNATFNVNILGGGNVIKQNTGTTNLVGTNTYTGGTTVSAGVLRGDTNSLQGEIVNNATLTFNQANTGIFNGTITASNGRVIKENSGLLIFNNTQFYTGGTLIRAGNLQIGDAGHPQASIGGPVTINSGGILSGHGLVNGTINNNGTISPGGSIGTLTVNGNVNFNRGSTFAVEIDPQQSSLLNVSRTANLGNAKVSVLANAGTYAPRTYTILQAASINGTFGGLDFSSVAANASLDLLTPSLQYLPNRVNLSLNVISNPAGPLRPVIDTWFETTLRTIGGRLNAPLGVACPEKTLGFWARGIGMVSSADTASTAPGYDGGTAGTVFGFDGQFAEQLTLGLAGFYANSDVTTQQLVSQHSSADSLGLSAYAAFTPGAWQFKGVIGYDNDQYRMHRTSLVNSAIQRIGKTQANRVNGYGEISYSFKTGNFSLQPLMGLQLGWMRQDGFTESGNGSNQNLNFDGRTLYTLDLLAGLRARQEFKLTEKAQAQVEIRLLYDHDFSTRQNSMSGRLNNRTINDFNTSDRPDQVDAGIFGASIALLNSDSLNFYLDYNGEIRSGQEAHFIGGGVRYNW